MKKKIVVFASGNGSNFEAIVDACNNNKINAQVVSMFTDNPNAKVLQRAKGHEVQTHIINPSDFENLNKWDTHTFELLSLLKPDLIVLAGFLKKLGPKVVGAFEGKIINTHPALLPKFGGQGMYGINVHKAVISSGDKISGISLHFVNNEFDAGKIIAQEKLEVLSSDTAESLCEKVKKAETPFLVDNISKILS